MRREWSRAYKQRQRRKDKAASCLHLVAEFSTVNVAFRPGYARVGVLFDNLAIIAVIGADILRRSLVIRTGQTDQGTNGPSSRIVLARHHIDLNPVDATRDDGQVTAIERIALSDRVAVVVAAIAIDRRIVDIVPVIDASLLAKFSIVACADRAYRINPAISQIGVIDAARPVADIEIVEAAIGTARIEHDALGGRLGAGLFGVAREGNPDAFIDTNLEHAAAIGNC